MITAKTVADSVNPDGDRLITMATTFPRFILAELNTHRVFSKNSASCLAGDTIITIESPAVLKKGRRGKHTSMTIKNIVDKWFEGDSKNRSMQNRIASMNLRCLNEDTGEYITTNITNCFRQGIQDIYEIELVNGYKLKCTKEHRIYTEHGWKTLNDYNVNISKSGIVHWESFSSKIATNGFELTTDWLINQKEEHKTLTKICEVNNLNFKSVAGFAEKNNIRFRKFIIENETFEYKNKDWLIEKLASGLFSTEIAVLCNTTSDRVKKQIAKYELKGNRYKWNSRKETWNTGKTYKQKEESLINVRAAAKRRIKKDSYLDYKDFNKKITRFLNEIREEIMVKYNYKCQITRNNYKLELHHIVPVWYNKELAFDRDNIIPLNYTIHRFIHNNNLDLEFMNYYLAGNDLAEFQHIYQNVKKKVADINKPRGRGASLVVRYYDIKNIKYIGKEETYDLEVSGPYHNFVANRIVVHNSRAIPYKKMVESVKTNPFIPIAWQREHSGMQGSEYLDANKVYSFDSFISALMNVMHPMDVNSVEYAKIKAELDAKIDLIHSLLVDYRWMKKTLVEWWLFARDKAVESATIMHIFGVTKQLCNRLLEPFMWHTVLISGTDYDNFFELRCPEYSLNSNVFKSWKDLTASVIDLPTTHKMCEEADVIEKLKHNKGQAEIHMMALAEAMWDARNESTPKYLNWGEWHIPFEDKIDEDAVYELDIPISEKDIDLFGDDATDLYVKISTAMAARVSYTTIGEEKEFGYDKQIALHDRMAKQVPFHASPFEHCAVAKEGRCRNFNGFTQYRHLLETK